MENFLDSAMLLGKLEKTIEDLESSIDNLETTIGMMGYDEVTKIKKNVESLRSFVRTKSINLRKFIKKEFDEELEEWMKEQKYIISSTRQLTEGIQ